MPYPIFFRFTDSRKLVVDKDSIFYREKYKEILNFIKNLLVDLEHSDLIKDIEPKGTLLINVNPATDLLDFIKLICHNYYLDLFELNFNEIRKSPNKFFNNFNYWLERLIYSIKETEKETKNVTENQEGREGNKDNRKKLLLINESIYLDEFQKNKSLLQEYIYHNFFNNETNNLIRTGIILIWVSYNSLNISELSNKIFNCFDLMIKIPNLTMIDRENILRSFLENNKKIKFNINLVLKLTDYWEIIDLKQLFHSALLRYFIDPELHENTDDITPVIINLIESGEYIPYNYDINQEEKKQIETQQNKTKIETNTPQTDVPPAEKIDSYIEQFKSNTPSEFMMRQLYEDAVSKHYNELLIVVDKLVKNEPLERNDKKLLALYPFILNEEPNNAKINLEKAKKRIDILKQAFKK
ncbi:MAG: hypothetical protein ACTSR8_20135 [Promethearchaeota archaeon]